MTAHGIDGLHEFAEGSEAAPGIGFALVGDDRADGALDADTRFVGDQGGFAVDRRRGGVDAGAQGIEGAYFLVGEVAVFGKPERGGFEGRKKTARRRLMWGTIGGSV